MRIMRTGEDRADQESGSCSERERVPCPSETRPLRVGYIVETHRKPWSKHSTLINKHGGSVLYPNELRERPGWVELERGPSLTLLLIALALMAVPVCLLPSDQSAGGRRSTGLRCRLALVALALDLCVLPWLLSVSMQQLHPRHTAVGGAQPQLDVELTIHSPGAPRVPQLPRGGACTLANHGANEDLYDKDRFALAIRAWCQARGCDYTAIVPPTFFPRPAAEPYAALTAGDCLRMAAAAAAARNRSRSRRSGPTWFVKDAGGGSHGRGVRLLTAAALLRSYLLDGGRAEQRCAQLRRESGAARVRRRPLLVQPGVAKPLLLSGGRKFDLRLYVLLPEHDPPLRLAAWLDRYMTVT